MTAPTSSASPAAAPLSPAARTEPPALPPGFMLQHFEIIRTLGFGNSAITYLAENTLNHRFVVIKEHFPAGISQRHSIAMRVSHAEELQKEQWQNSLESFLEDAGILSQLSHPNLATGVTCFEELGTAYFVSSYVEAPSIQRALPPPARLSENRLLPLLRNILAGLDYLHTEGLAHHDLHPDNILLHDGRTPVLVDAAPGFAATHHKDFMPPEQLRGSLKGTLAADIYALGATFHTLITGHTPPNAVRRAQGKEDYLPLSHREELQGRYSSELLSGIDRALSLHPTERWSNAEDWLFELPGPQIAHTEEPAAAIPDSTTALATLSQKNISPEEYPEQLLRAAARGEHDKLSLLLAAGASTEVTDDNGRTPLILACHGGHADCVQRLLSMPGIRTELEDYYGCTALSEAIRQDHAECIRLMLNTPGAITAGYSPLYLAIIRNRPEEIPQALSAEENALTQPDPGGLPPLCRAAASGRAECLKQLLATEGVNPNLPDASGNTPLHHAIDKEKPDCTELLLKAAGIQVNTTDYSGNTPLHLAAAKGYTEGVKLLLRVGHAGTNRRNKDEQTPLTLAAAAGHKACIKLLVGAENFSAGDYPPLYLAVAEGAADKVKNLLATEDTDMHAADAAGESPLHLAAAGQPKLLRMLLSVPGAETGCTNEKGETPLHRAAACGQTECVQLLLNCGIVNVDAPTKTGESPLCYAAKNGHTECMLLLMEAGANVNHLTHKAETALCLAAASGQANSLQLLLDCPDTDLNPMDDNGASPIILAAARNHPACVKRLLAAPGTDANHTTNSGHTALYTAAGMGHARCVELLLKAPGILVNLADQDGVTPLTRAAEEGRTRSLKLLLSHKDIDLTATDTRGRSPLRAARDAEHSTCVELIQEAIRKQAHRKIRRRIFTAAACLPLVLLPIPVYLYGPHVAATQNYPTILKLLMKLPGIDMQRQDAAGKTPLQLAEEAGHTECAALLKQAVEKP